MTINYRQDAGSFGERIAVEIGEYQVRTKFVRLRSPVRMGERLHGWRVCWLGGWDKAEIFFVVMVERKFRRIETRRQPVRVAPSPGTP
jgi:hypothetical protein